MELTGFENVCSVCCSLLICLLSPDKFCAACCKVVPIRTTVVFETCGKVVAVRGEPGLFSYPRIGWLNTFEVSTAIETMSL
jgi:hypothetical protein